MNNIIFGAGAVGLAIALEIKNNNNLKNENLIVIDKYNLPSQGTSVKNSGVLHAGLYYKPNSLKANLCIKGARELSDWCQRFNLPLLQCGKILVPFEENDSIRLKGIYKNAKENNCSVKYIEYKEASKIQPGIIKKENYLWSPKTSVFSPSAIINSFFQKLLEENVTFLKCELSNIDLDKKEIYLTNGDSLKFNRFFNCAGAGALDISRKVTKNFKNLDILPILGEYALQTSGIKIRTNLYPVPDPELPFLGIHLTPRTDGKTLIGPNAIPALRDDIQAYTMQDITSLPKKILYHADLFANNRQNYRDHAYKEFCLIPKNKFIDKSRLFLSKEYRSKFDLEMNSYAYGIRPQLIDKKNRNFINDFLYENIDGNIHIINAVSPAFSSCLAIAKHIISSI